MPKPEPAPIEAQQTTTVTRRWTADRFVVEATRPDKGDTTITLARHPGAQIDCPSPRCDRQIQVPPWALSLAEVDGLIRLLTHVRDVRLPELGKFGAEE